MVHWKHFRPARTIAAVALGAASALALPVTAQANDIPAISAATTLEWRTGCAGRFEGRGE